MVKRHSTELPKDIRDSLRRIVRFAGNEKAVDEDPAKVLSMFLFAIERELDIDSTYTVLKALLKEYCSPDGMIRFAHRLEQKKTA